MCPGVLRRQCVRCRYLSCVTDWAPVVLAAVGSGVAGSIVTTYGSQTRERHQARAQARDAIREVQMQSLVLQLPSYEELRARLDRLETAAMLARLPRKLTALHGTALFIMRDVLEGAAEGRNSSGDSGDRAFAADHVASETTWSPPARQAQVGTEDRKRGEAAPGREARPYRAK